MNKSFGIREMEKRVWCEKSERVNGKEVKEERIGDCCLDVAILCEWRFSG